MSSTSNPPSLPSQTLSSRLRNLSIGAIFAIILLLPKLLHLRRNEGSWLVFRSVLGLVGAALVIFPLGFWNSYLLSILGLALFIAAILLPPAVPDTTADDKVKELNALIVVNGGAYQPGNAPAAATKLFIGSDHIWALDSHFQPLVVISVREIASADAEKAGPDWRLLIHWNDHTAEFIYRGFFSEHLARVAESSVRSVMVPVLPVLPQRRAASA